MSTNIFHEIYNDIKTKCFTSFTDKVYMDEENVYMLAKQSEYAEKDDYFDRYDAHYGYDFNVVNFFHLNTINRKTLRETHGNSTFVCLGGIDEKPLIFRRRFKEHFNSIVSFDSDRRWYHTDKWKELCEKHKNLIFHEDNTYIKEFPVHKFCSIFLYVRINDGVFNNDDSTIPYICNFSIEAYIKAFNYEMSLWNNGEVNELKNVCPEFVKTYNAFFKPIEKLTNEEKKLIKPLMPKVEFDKRIKPLYDKNDIVVKCKKFATIEGIDFYPAQELISTNGDCEKDEDLSALISGYVHSFRTYNGTKDLVGSKFKSPIKAKEFEVFFSINEPNYAELFKSTKYGMINVENYDHVYANKCKKMAKQYLETIARISNISKEEVLGGL